MSTKKDGKPITFKCTSEFREEVEKMASINRESLSKYIRKAVETRNKRFLNLKLHEDMTMFQLWG